MKSLATVFENRCSLLEICDTERCRESVLEYLVVYLKDDDSKLTEKGRNKVVTTGSCFVQYVRLS